MVMLVDGEPSAKLVRLQHVQKELAQRFARYCRERGFQPFLAAGSALGAQRHGDIIPWDDDIDFGMVRPEYDAFIEAFIAQPIAGVVLQCSKTTADYPYTFAKLRLEGTTVVEWLALGDKFHRGIFIDVFPYDSVPNSAVTAKIQLAMLSLCNFIVLSFNRQLAMGATRPLYRQLRLLAVALRPVLPIGAFAAMREWILRKTWNPSSRRLASFHMYGLRDAAKTWTKLATLLPPKIVKFGEGELPVPADCDAYLKGIFGDYQVPPPPEKRWPTHIRDVNFGESAS